MLYLNPNTPKIIKARRSFHDGMSDFVFKRIDKIKKIEKVDTAKIIRFFDLIINDHIDEILVEKPGRLIELNNQIDLLIDDSPDIRKGVQYVFSYDTFISKAKTRYDAYKLAELLDISTCTYCNRNYTNTVIRNNGYKITRPQFDHYFDKDTYPLLAVSFYNLIPSCSTCNSSIKGTKKMTLADFLHPYLDNGINDIKFTYKYSKDTTTGLQVQVVTPDPSKSRNTVEVFAIEDVYNCHTGELLELIKTRQYFSDRYLSILSANLLRDVIVSKEELYRIVFGTEYDVNNFINRPFSKFKSDILKELGVI
ncbi:hypothetical protein [Dyadobacter sp. CY356]|uniref:hypothetical protein n=1 Tax=Dyadobacter sp. CY356 TaxID=2906442 RepID=UPI001F357AE2|nr:hypothetical protein [Dyadobacter sp. CY356]MCF0055346.1 hypothetical protein [Dyadobacter sp. CY356]